VMQQCKGRLVQGFEERLPPAVKIWHQIWTVWKLTGWKLEYDRIGWIGWIGWIGISSKMPLDESEERLFARHEWWDTSPGVQGPITRMCWIRTNLDWAEIASRTFPGTSWCRSTTNISLVIWSSRRLGN
jgi:hypothetical protein